MRRQEMNELPKGFPSDDFWSKVEEAPGGGGCLRWAGKLDASGDGAFYWRPSPDERHLKLSARRVAWMDQKGPIRRRWKIVATCGVPGCVYHLEQTPRERDEDDG